MADLTFEQDALLDLVHRSRRNYRERIARVLHDGVCQSITAAGLNLDLAKMEMTPENAAKAGEVQEMLERAFDEVRRLSHETHPDPVQRFGADQAVERLAESARRRFKGEFRAKLSGLPTQDPEKAAAIIEILDAALDNAIRHASAGRITLTVTPQRVEVKDDGRGFDTNPSNFGLGLVMMSYWARRIGMELRVSSTVARGTSVQLR